MTKSMDWDGIPYVNINDIVGLAEIADLVNIRTIAVRKWPTTYPDFPKAIRELQTGPLFNLVEVQRWLREHKRMGNT